jgi:hypothetical protein
MNSGQIVDSLVSIALGVGLSAACGFRVFVPLLVMSVASLTGHLHLSQGFAWIGTYPALIAFATATVAEIAAYYIPWLGHFLDSVASPAAVIAGTVATASVVTELSPLLRWVLALIAGGGAAGIIQSGTVGLRLKSTALTGGLGNPIVSTAELLGSTVTAILAIIIPVVCFILVIAGSVFIFRKYRQLVLRLKV